DPTTTSHGTSIPYVGYVPTASHPQQVQQPQIQQQATQHTSPQPPISHHAIPSSASTNISQSSQPPSLSTHTAATTSPIQQYAQQQQAVSQQSLASNHQHHQQHPTPAQPATPPTATPPSQSQSSHHQYAQHGLPTHIDPSVQQSEAAAPYFHSPTPPAGQADSPYGSFGLAAQGQHQQSSHLSGFGSGDYGYGETQRGFYESYAPQSGFGTRAGLGHEDIKGLPATQQQQQQQQPPNNAGIPLQPPSLLNHPNKRLDKDPNKATLPRLSHTIIPTRRIPRINTTARPTTLVMGYHSRSSSIPRPCSSLDLQDPEAPQAPLRNNRLLPTSVSDTYAWPAWSKWRRGGDYGKQLYGAAGAASAGQGFMGLGGGQGNAGGVGGLQVQTVAVPEVPEEVRKLPTSRMQPRMSVVLGHHKDKDKASRAKVKVDFTVETGSPLVQVLAVASVQVLVLVPADPRETHTTNKARTWAIPSKPLTMPDFTRINDNSKDIGNRPVEVLDDITCIDPTMDAAPP
ncbi:hypothetical protein BD779DRAFT_1678480, partial [Infundibulicybe gibba]